MSPDALPPLRDAVETDLPAIVAIYNATIPGRMSTADTVQVPIDSRVQWFRAHSPARWPIWVIDSRDGIAAWLSLQPFHERLAYRHTAELSVYVAETHRREGLARRLVTHALGQAPGLQMRTLVGLVFGHNEPSLRLLEGLGFARWGNLPRIAALDGVERDLVIVGRRVDVEA